jgi:hypothetical protein
MNSKFVQSKNPLFTQELLANGLIPFIKQALRHFFALEFVLSGGLGFSFHDLVFSGESPDYVAEPP